MWTEPADNKVGEVERLVLEIQKGNTDLLPVLWQHVEPFIRKRAAYRWQRMRKEGTVAHFSDDIDDFVQQSYFALLDAVRGYTPETGASFTTYLAFFLRRSFFEVDGIRTKKRDALIYAESLDAPIAGTDADDLMLVDTIADTRDPFQEVEDKIALDELHKALVKAVDALPGRKRTIIKARFYNGEKQTEIARRYGCTKQAVSCAEKAALADLRRYAAKYGLDAFLDIQTPFIRPSGYRAFANADFTSSVELSVYDRERYRNEYKKYSEP